MRQLLWIATLLGAQAAQAEPVQCAKAVALFQPKAGVIPTERFAKNIANSYLGEVYGAQIVHAELPLVAKLQDGVWTVEGSLPRGADGGVAAIRLCRRNGAVLSIVHGK